jgi:8-oxo-dGTP pyrophosphatase MutT (NUDIX family)
MSESQKPLRRGVAAVIVRERRFLVIRRALTVEAPGAFCFPGGAIEPGESEEEALVRELREELGAAVLPLRRIWTSRTSWGVELAWWRAELADGASIVANAAEVASFHWHDPGELAAVPGLLESNHRFLEAFARGEIVL